MFTLYSALFTAQDIAEHGNKYQKRTWIADGRSVADSYIYMYPPAPPQQATRLQGYHTSWGS